MGDKIIKRFDNQYGFTSVVVELDGREFDARVNNGVVTRLHRVTWLPHYRIPGRREQEAFRSISANHKSRASIDDRILKLVKDETASVALEETA